MVAFRQNDSIGNLIGWWELAGVTVPVSDQKAAWLAPPAQMQTEPARVRSEKTGSQGEMPGTLAEFLEWRRSSAEVPEAAWPGSRILPEPPSDIGIMVISDVPDGDDMAAGTLLSGSTGKLFDRMMRSIGLEREKLYLCSLGATRPPGGLLHASSAQMLAKIMHHHIALAAPTKLLLLGDKTSRALLSADAGGGRGKLHSVNHAHGTVSAIATFHPRFLMRQPAAKAECWKDLQIFMKEACS